MTVSTSSPTAVIARDERAHPGSPEERAVERAVLLGFAPLHKRVFGTAVGVAVATLFALVTIASLMHDATGHSGLAILGVYFRGYDVSPRGIIVGALWGGFVGFVGGWFLAFCRNLVLATWLIYVRARAALKETRDFLDHI